MRKPLLGLVFLLTIFCVKAQTGSSTLIISQIYGDGGTSGSTYSNDFIEIYNRGTTPIDLSNYSVQYAAGANWSVTPLTPIVLQPGKYYLIKQASNGSGGSLLPPSDASGITQLHSNSGKVALVNSLATLPNGCSSSPSIVDLVGYGNVTCSEGSPATGGTNTLSIIRKAGNADTDNNSVDFTTATPNARNGLFTLPIHFSEFSVQKKHTGNELTWRINCNTNSVTINVLHSTNAADFKNIYTQSASRERCSSAFTFNDLNFSNGINYYRLKVTDANNSIDFSNVIGVNNKTGSNSLSLYSLDNNHVSINYYASSAGPARIIIIDQVGRVVLKKIKNFIAGKNLITLSTSSLQPGTYRIAADNKSLPFVKY